MKTPILLLFAFFSLVGCNTKKKSLTVLTDRYESVSSDRSTVSLLSKGVEDLNIILAEDADTTSTEQTLLNRVNKGEADMAIIKNDIMTYDPMSNVRTLMPLFPEVLLTLYKEKSQFASDTALLRNGVVAIVTDKEEERLVIERFLKNIQCIPSNILHFKNSQDSATLAEASLKADAIVMFSSLNNPNVARLLNQENRFILYNTQEAASSVVGFCTQYPQAVPYVIPKGIFNGFPKAPVATFAVYDVLICNKNLEPEVVYDLTESIFNAKARLALDNFEFGLLSEDFNDHNFLFPLHPGVVDYQTRDQPSFLERYSEAVGLFVSLVVIATGAISTSYNKLKQRKKDKVDEYYKYVLKISDKAHESMVTSKELERYLNELFMIRNHAFQLLVDERVEANNSFVIFLMLLQSTVEYIESQVQKMRLVTHPVFLN